MRLATPFVWEWNSTAENIGESGPMPKPYHKTTGCVFENAFCRCCKPGRRPDVPSCRGNTFTCLGLLLADEFKPIGHNLRLAVGAHLVYSHKIAACTLCFCKGHG